MRVQASQPRSADSTALQPFTTDFLHLVQDYRPLLLGLWHPRDSPRARRRIQFAECNHYHHGHHYYPHNHAVVVNSFWPFWYPGYPYAYGYRYVWPPIFNDSDNYDSQPASNYAARPPDDYNNVPYQTQPYPPQPEDQPEPPAPPDSFPQQPNTSHRALYSGAPSSASFAPPVTLVFKDGRPPEQIHNYLLTANTLTVLDQNRRDVPVSQIDLDATTKANLQTGVNFSLPIQ